MQVTKTLQWIQQHPHGAVRANVLTTVTSDAGVVVARSGEDLTLDQPDVVSAANALESAVLAATGATLPATPATAPAA